MQLDIWFLESHYLEFCLKRIIIIKLGVHKGVLLKD